MNQLTDKFFWFIQPGTLLTEIDFIFGYIFAGLLAVGIIVWIAKKFVQHPIMKKLLAKIQIMALTVSIFGLVWFGFRYETTPIFARRFWAGLIILGGIIWLGFIKKYAIFNFPKEKLEYEKQELKNKYIPQKR